MVMGVATHFDQGWPVSRLDEVADVGLKSIRDDLPWGKNELSPGVYDFSSPNAAYVRQACDRGMDILLMVEPRHAHHDGGLSAHSTEAQHAYARYLDAVLKRFGTRCIVAIEVGNELNGGGLHYPAGTDVAKSYTQLLKTVFEIVKPHHPSVKILGGSTNMIGTGYLEKLFAAGALRYMDGVVVHPYRDDPEGVDIELARLQAAMSRHGVAKPIWATEFGDEVDDPGQSPSLMLRTLSILSAAGVERAYWYALLDEPAYRHMGMFDPSGRMKPAGKASRAIVSLLLPARARRVAEDGRTFLYDFGDGRFVLWGAPRPIRFNGKPKAFDALGAAIALPDQVSATPVILNGRFSYQLGPSPVLADSLYEFGRPPWSYFARRSDGRMEPLAMIDWDWTSYYGGPSLRPLEITYSSAISAGDGGNPIDAVVRYTAPTRAAVIVSSCLRKKAAGDGMTIVVRLNGREIYAKLLTEKLAMSLPLELARGDVVDFAFGPNQQSGDDGLRYAIRLLRRGAPDVVACE